MPLWPGGYCELKTVDAPKYSGRAFTSSLIAYKNLDRGLGPGRELSPEIIIKNMS